MFPYAPPHGHDTCPELNKLKESKENSKTNIIQPNKSSTKKN